MHRLAALPGGWTPDTEGVIFIDQTPAPLVLITAADTDIQVIAAAQAQLSADFPDLRVASLLQLQQNLTIDTYAETVLSQAKGIVLRLLGGQAYWSYGLEVVEQLVERTGAKLLVLPGDDSSDPALFSHSTVPIAAVDRLWRYFNEGGIQNVTHALQWIADLCLGSAYHPPAPQAIPKVGLYPWRGWVGCPNPAACPNPGLCPNPLACLDRTSELNRSSSAHSTQVTDPNRSDCDRSDPIQSDCDRSDCDRSDPIQSDCDRSDCDRSDYDRSDCDRSDPIQSDCDRSGSHPDASGELQCGYTFASGCPSVLSSP
ncbi:MAG: hypothetical protein MUF72_22625, partial [Elainella sp. Prado103]|nr:hypothetical protein [Elainella sp. Prado103]